MFKWFALDLTKRWRYYLIMFIEIFLTSIFYSLMLSPLIENSGQIIYDDKINYDCLIDHIDIDCNSIDEFKTYLNDNVGDYSLINTNLIEDSENQILYTTTSIDLNVLKYMKLHSIEGSFSTNYSEEYKEAMVSSSSPLYVGNTYEFDEIGKIKVVGTLKNDYTLSLNPGTYRVQKIKYSMLILEDTQPISYIDNNKVTFSSDIIVYSSINKVSELQKLNFNSPVGEICNYNKSYKSYNYLYFEFNSSYTDALFMIILFDSIFMITIAINVLINKKTTIKKDAIYYLCGASKGKIIAFELIKTMLAFIFPCLAILIISPLLLNSTKFIYIIYSLITIFITYLIPQIISIINIFKANYLNDLRGIKND